MQKLSNEEQLERIKKIMAKPEKREKRFILNFGKHKGRCLGSVSEDYLRYLSNNHENEKIVEMVELELEKRGRL